MAALNNPGAPALLTLTLGDVGNNKQTVLSCQVQRENKRWADLRPLQCYPSRHQENQA